MRVLVIDDDEMSRELLAVLLEAEGYAICSADSGEAALALLESGTPPRLILTDMQMPGSSPTQLAGRLRRACGRRTVLLAMSGSQPSPADLARYDGFLLKPFGIAELASAIESAGAQHISPDATKKARSPKPSSAKKIRTLDLAAAAAEPASNRSVSSAPILDEAIYRQLASAMPAPQLREMYSMCLGDARARIGSMRTLAAEHDEAEFMREAHAIKGSCGMLGATELHGMASVLEKNGPGSDGSAVNSLDELSDACDRLERMLGSRA